MAGRRRPRLGVISDGTIRPLDRLVEPIPAVAPAKGVPNAAVSGEADLAALEARRAKWSAELARVERARQKAPDANGAP